ncbi:MAG: TonB family protein [Gemmatimonadaceae bacterium]
MKRQLLSTAIALASAAAPISTQTIAGRVVDYATRRSVGRVSIELVDDSARVVGSAEGDTTGIFYVDAPGPGRYRIVIIFASGSSFFSPVIRAAVGDYIEREFVVPAPAAALSDAFFVGDVDVVAVAHAGNAPPRYPDAMASRETRGMVVAMFVVGEDGRPETRTLQTLSTSDSAFAAAVRDALGAWRYDAALRDGKRVRQVVQVAFHFALPGDAPSDGATVRTVSSGATAGEAVPEGMRCDADVRGATLDGWRQVVAERFTFCVPPDWIGDGESWRGTNGATVSLSLGDGESGAPSQVGALGAMRSAASAQPRSATIGGRPVALYSSRQEGRYHWAAVWMSSAISFLGTAFDRATSDLELTIFRTVRVARR